MNLKGLLKKNFKNTKIPLFQIVLGIAAVVLLLLIVPQIINMGKISKDLNQKKKILTNLDSGIKNFTALEQEFESLNNAYNGFVERLPQQKEFPVFLELLSKLAKANNVKIVAIEPQKAIDDPTLFFIKTPVFIDAYAGYHDIGRFISSLERSSNFMRVEDIKISQADSEPGKEQLFLNVHAFCIRE